MKTNLYIQGSFGIWYAETILVMCGMKKDPEIHFEEAVSDDVVWSENYLEVPTSRKAFLLIAGLTLGLAILVLSKVTALNLFNQEFYEARASANVSREISLPTYRAVITDRFGEPLTKNTSSFSVFLNVPKILSQPGRLKSTIDNLGEILNLNKDELLKLIQGVDLEQDNWAVVARNITPTEVIAIKGLNEEALEIIDDYEREYIDAPAFAHVIGYTGIGRNNSIVGKSGLEFQYDELIRGTDGRYTFYADALGRVLSERVLSAPKPNPPLETTLDADFQRYFYRRLKSGLESLGRKSGVGIGLNPKTGEILALVSLPSFDNNVFVDRRLSEERGQILTNASEPLFNRAIAGNYSPGSTVKPLVALTALREGIVDEDSKIFSDGALEIPNPYNPEAPSIFLDWQAHGWVDIRAALARSSNIYFYLMGGGLPQNIGQDGLVRGAFKQSGIGVSKFVNYWQKFKFGAPSGIDLPFESDGFLPNPEEKEARTDRPWLLGDTYNVSIGQGDLLVTPLQLIDFIASIGNGGKIYKPFLSKSTKQEVLADYGEWQEEIRAVRLGLRDAVEKPYGSSHILNDLPVKVAGKTGTPQIQNNERVNALFAGYAPADDPEIAILVLVENAREGSFNALPIAKDVFRWYYENRLKRDANIQIHTNDTN